MKLICCVFTVNWISNLFKLHITLLQWIRNQFCDFVPISENKAELFTKSSTIHIKNGRSCFETWANWIHLNFLLKPPDSFWSLQVFYCYINSYYIKYWWAKLRVHAFFKEKSFLLENSYCTFFSQKNSSYP